MADPVNADVVVNTLEGEGISAEIIGSVLHLGKGVLFRKGDDIQKATKFERDKLTKIFE